jgi:uncharacterized protein with von Willebrand factor type A (vWA) domain
MAKKQTSNPVSKRPSRWDAKVDNLWRVARDAEIPHKNAVINGLSAGTTVALGLADQWMGNKVVLNELGNEGENDLARDVFYSLFRRTNPMRDPVPTDRVVNRKIIDWLTSGPNWSNVINTTVSRRFVAQSSADVLTVSLLNDPDVQKLMEEQKKIEDKLQQAMEAELQASEDGEFGDGVGAEKNAKKAADARKQAEAMAQELEQKAEEFTNSTKAKTMRAGVSEQAKQAANEANELEKGWSDGVGGGSEMDAETLRAMYEQYKNTGMSKLVEYIGRARGVARNTISTRKTVEMVVTDAGMTQDLESVFSDEMMLLSPDAPQVLQATQMSELLDNGLLGTVKATETKMLGNMIFAVDESGSMDGNRSIRAKAITLGMCRAAEENGQEWSAFGFSDGEYTDVITQDTPADVQFKWATYEIGGGTDFNEAILRAIDILKDMEDPTLADIVMITDGCAQVDDATGKTLRELKEQYGTRFIVIFVDTATNINLQPDAKVVLRSNDDFEKAADALAKALWE